MTEDTRRSSNRGVEDWRQTEISETVRRAIVDVIAGSGLAPELPDGLEPAIKFTAADLTTRGGFDWFRRGWVAAEEPFNPTTCAAGGLHVARTVAAAQSGGGRSTHCLWVGVDPAEAGPWEGDKRKARRVWVAGPVDFHHVLRVSGAGADLRGAHFRGADLGGADLYGAYLYGADLGGADGRDDWAELVGVGR